MLGIVLDGIPESIVIGVTLVDGGGVSVALIAAVFLSNLPEAIAATTGLEKSGWARSRILWLWALIMAVDGRLLAARLRPLRRCLGEPDRVRPGLRRGARS